MHSELQLTGKIPFVDAEQISVSQGIHIGVFDLNDVPVMSAQACGIEDIMTPVQAIQAQLRDLVIAHRRLVTVSEQGNLPVGTAPFLNGSSLEAALQWLMDTLRQSFVHEEALQIALGVGTNSAQLLSLVSSYRAV